MIALLASVWTVLAPAAFAVESSTQNQAVTVEVPQRETIEVDEATPGLIVYKWYSATTTPALPAATSPAWVPTTDCWASEEMPAGRLTAVSNANTTRTITASVTSFSGASVKYALEARLDVIVDGVVYQGARQFLTVATASGSTLGMTNGSRNLLTTFTPTLGGALFPGTVDADIYYRARTLDDEDPGSQTFTVTFTVTAPP